MVNIPRMNAMDYVFWHPYVATLSISSIKMIRAQFGVTPQATRTTEDNTKGFMAYLQEYLKDGHRKISEAAGRSRLSRRSVSRVNSATIVSSPQWEESCQPE
jgi:hypothetical protein